MRLVINTGLSCLLLSSLAVQAGCGVAFCSLNTDAGIQGAWDKPGVRLDVRAEFIDLDQLRHGSHKTSPSGEPGAHDDVRTLNRNLLTSLDWNINQDWGMTLRLPYVNRAHKQLENEDNGQGGVDTALEKFDFSGIGDLQALGRYHFYRDDTSSAGVRFGLKLPTGSIHKHNSEEDAERALQPGTGSVDSLMGAYYNKRVDHLSWFVQGMWQQTVHERDDFRPGRKLSLDTGLSYSATPELNLMLQLNLQHRAKDRGSNAETRDSGLYSASLSPGLSYRIKSGTQVYAFVQKPIYQYVNGEQLTADWSLAVGLTTQF